MGIKEFVIIGLGLGGVTVWDIYANPRCRRMLPWSDMIDCAINPPCSCPTVLFNPGSSIVEGARKGGGYQEQSERRRGSARGSGNAGAGGSGGGDVFPGEFIPYTIYKPNLDPLGNIGKPLAKGSAKITQQKSNTAQKHSNKQACMGLTGATLEACQKGTSTLFTPPAKIQVPAGVPFGTSPRPASSGGGGGACEWWNLPCHLAKAAQNIGQGKTIFGQPLSAIQLPQLNPLSLPKIGIPTLPRLTLPVP